MSIDDLNHLTTWYAERAVQFIEKNKSHPFFLYVAHNMPHVPLGVSDKFRGKTARGLYGDVIEEIDWSVGPDSGRAQAQRPGGKHLGDLHFRQRPVALLTAITPDRPNRCAKAKAPTGRAARANRASCAGRDIFPPGPTPGTC